MGIMSEDREVNYPWVTPHTLARLAPGSIAHGHARRCTTMADFYAHSLYSER